MQILATGVGDLKRLLTNVKSRGTWAEVGLGNLLEEMMAPDQYCRNVEIGPGSNQRVEYAIRLPGDGENPVWLPLDAKFPVEDYERLVDASQRGDVDAVEVAAKSHRGRYPRLSQDDLSEIYPLAALDGFRCALPPDRGSLRRGCPPPWPSRCPPARVAHYGGRADNARLASSIAVDGFPIARYPAAFRMKSGRCWWQ
jgi:RmuC family protein